MRYELFFELEVRHQYAEYYEQDWVIIPDEATMKVLDSAYFLVKSTIKGLIVWKCVGEGITDISDEVFGFTIFPTSEKFCEYTDEQLSEGNVRLFTSKGLNRETFELVKSETPCDAKFKGFSAVARVEIIGKEVKPRAKGKVPVYQAVFQPKAVKWRYYFVTKTASPELQVEDQNRKIVFEKIPVRENSSDQTVQSLQVSYPETQIVVFESTQVVASESSGIKNIRLIQNENVIIRNLPNPEPANNGIEIIQLR